MENVKIEDIKDLSLDEVTAKINELYKKSKEEGLSDSEKEIQQALRKRYVDAVKGNLKSQLSGLEYKKK
ncbi:MAG: DUF896 domain-containing protein [Clostridium sp.]|uniref:DUF896 domain-containing protein n=1 Tax=Clostridium sp. TaxID=1506 RepID=UPI003EE526B4